MPLNVDVASFAASRNPDVPRRFGQRYNAEKFLPEAGNTVVCHLDFDASAHKAVLDARKRMMALPEAGRFLFTPAESLHMTVFEGVIETRRTPDTWPRDLDRDASVSSVTDAMIDRLADFSAPSSFAVRVTGCSPTGLALKGATDEDEAKMLAWREALTEPFAYRHEDHDAYQHHMTFAYPITWLPDAVLPIWEAELAAILADLAEAAPVIPLAAPAFCQFADMTRFEELRVLST
ncbi:DUF1868 domain-containing protein [Ruegeria arenilitoris]|uniref:DUF1868 domain-containing protein n=1 Tax=Ruegeria arenilitoris TaxID=1173585 RepID=UPI0034640CB4